MRKFYSIVALALFGLGTAATAQKNGSMSGIWGTYGMSSFMNNDDANFPLLTQKTTLKYGGGIEKGAFWGNHFGHGFQLSYHAIGQDYTYNDTINKLTINTKSELQAVRAAIVFYYRSYNRYYPTRKLRFNSYFGPYANVHPLFSEKITVLDANSKIISEGSFTPLGYRNALTSAADFDLTAPIYKFTSYGFTFSPGIEFTLGQKTTLFLNLRSDINTGNIENRDKIERKQTVGPNLPFNYWDNIIAKGFPSPVPINEFNRRPATKVFFAGATMGIRFYTHDQAEDK